MVHAAEETRIRMLATMARVLGRSEALFRILEVAAEEARRALDAASVSISRLEVGTMTVRTIVNVGDLGPDEVRWPENETYQMYEFENLRLDLDNLTVWTFERSDPDCLPRERELLDALDKEYSIAAPIVVDGRLWGEFYATRHRGATGFDETDEACLEVLIAVLAGAISRSLREESLEQLAYKDPLTGLFNRRMLDEQAVQAFRVAPGARRNVTVVTCDINGLKQVNDSLGHVVGDQLIQSIGRTLVRSFDRLLGSLVARVGGDEFTVLLTGHDPAQVIAVSDEVCRMTWEFGAGASVSCGAATAVVSDGSPLTPTDLFAAADQAQYVAKRARLTRTVVADEFGLEPSFGT